MKFLLVIISVLMSIIAMAQPPLEWESCFGGSGLETAFSIKQISNKGYVVTGFTEASNDGDVSGNNGFNDAWIIKIDSVGNILWQKCFGGSQSDGAFDVVLSSDSGFVVAAYSSSNDFDVSNNNGGLDFWIVKLDSVGNINWEKSYGGSNTDIAHSIDGTFDGGYVISGYTMSNDIDVSSNNGGLDLWVIKIDSLGNLIWEKSLGGTSDEWDNQNYYFQTSVKQTIDSCYILAGTTISNDGDVSGNHGGFDCWVIKIDSIGNILWEKTIGGSNDDVATSISQTFDGNYIVSGYSSSSDGDLSSNQGNKDLWVIKLSNSGNIIWSKTYGGSGHDEAYSIKQTNDYGYIVVGSSNSIDGDVTGNMGSIDFWVIKLDALGNISWQKTIGGSGYERARSVQQTNNGAYILSGNSESNDGDVSGQNGMNDFWVVKLGPNSGISSLPNNQTIDNNDYIYPNPSSNTISISNSEEVKIYNWLGQLVLSKTNLENETVIDIAHLANGIYYVILEHSYQKLIKN